MPKLELVRYDEEDMDDTGEETKDAGSTALNTATGAASLESMTAEEICNMPIPKRTYLIHRLAAQGAITELIGKLKRGGKTTLLLHAIKALTSGKNFFDKPTSKCPVVYLTEQSPTVIQKQLQGAGLDNCKDLHIVFWGKTYGRKWAAVVRDARALAKQK